MPENQESSMARPNIPACVDNPAHNFLPLGNKSVYCTKCAAHVKFTKGKK